MSKSNLLILERSLSEITINEEAKVNGDYILEGIFSIMGKKNKNNRIYDEAEFIPHIEELAKKVKAKKVLGELDHPKQFEISLKNVSHVIEDISYDKETKTVKGKIKLLDTRAGKEAKALVDAGVPIHISSRAAGVVEQNGHVKIKQLFTYDLVHDPGVEEAVLNRVNESFGLEDNSPIQIFTIEENLEQFETEIKSNKMEKAKEAKYITVEDFDEYTKIIKNEFNTLKENLTGLSGNMSEDTKDIKPNGELIKYVEKIAESVNELSESMSTTIVDVDNLISHNDYIIDGLETVKDYAELVALKSDQGIEYTKKIAESTDNAIEYAKMVAEKTDQSIEYAKMVGENLDNSISYQENTNEHLDKLTEYTKSVVEDVDLRIQYQDEVNESTDNLISHNDYIIEGMNGISKHQDYLKENIENLGNYTESIVDTINEENGFEKKENNEEYQKLTESVELPDLGNMDEWKNGIMEKLNNLTESAKKQKAVEESKELNFLNFLSESKRSDFDSLGESERANVILAFNENKYFGSNDAERIYEGVFVQETPKTNPWLDNMPSKFKSIYESLSDSRKNEIKAQASISNLNTQYQVDHFWSTRDLRETKVNLVEEKNHAAEVNPVNESAEYKTPSSYMDAVQEGLKQRFGK
jgi:hypothetical protein